MLGRLGNHVQHALRAFTPDDAKALRATVRTFPKSDFYDLEELLTQMGTSEAAVTILSESGVPTPVMHAPSPPHARMGPADDVDGTARSSALYAKYGTRLDSQSAREMLAARLSRPRRNLPARHRRASARRRRPKPREEAPTPSETSSSPRPEGRSSASWCAGSSAS